MQPNQKFLKQPGNFWANVRTISQHLGYTDRRSGNIKVPQIEEMAAAMADLSLSSDHLVNSEFVPAKLGAHLARYFQYRADVINREVRSHLMNVNQARELFEKLKFRYQPSCLIPMNKQKGVKKAEAYFTGIINILIEAHAEGMPCDYNPQELTSVTLNNTPFRTLARRVDGAFPATVNPVAVWEIKEYYYTTTFGSRVADGVYETLLDGMELEEILDSEGIKVRHYLMVDDYNTWWNMGKSYLCRIIDMLHMGYVDEVLFGSEVTTRLPLLVKEWVAIARARQPGLSP